MTLMRETASGITLAYDCFGAPLSRPLLLISGLSTPMTRWTTGFCEQLADRGFYVIRFDNRDCGLSTHLNQHLPARSLSLLWSRLTGIRIRPPYTLDDMADDATHLLDGLGIKSAHIVGRSMGGLIAQRLAYRHPERVRSLSLLMSTSGHRGLPMPTLAVLRRMLMRPPRPTQDLERYLQHRVDYTRAIGSQKFPFSESAVRQRVLDDLARSGFNPGSGRRQLMALLHAGDQRSILKALHQPTIVIHGDADPLVPLACGLDIQRHVPGATMVVVPDMGHSLHPAFFAPIIQSIETIAAVADSPQVTVAPSN